MGIFQKVIVFAAVFCSVQAPAAMSEFADPSMGRQTVQACQKFLASGKCDQFKGQPGALQENQCQAEVNGDNWSVLSRLANCGKGVKVSAGTLWENIKSIGSSTISAAGGIYNYLTDKDSRAATHESVQEAWKTAGEYLESIYPYIAMEFQKALSEAYKKGGDPGINAMNAATQIAPRLMGKMMSAAMEIIKAKYEEFHCFENNKQVEMVCKVAADLLMPPTAIITLYKAGVKGLAGLPKLTTKIEEMLKLGAKVEERIDTAANIKENAVKAKNKAEESLNRLQKILNDDSKGSHALRQNADGTTTLQIGTLRRDQKEFMVSANKAIREGKVQVVEAGYVVGPKALSGLKNFSDSIPQNAKQGVTFKGTIHGTQLQNNYDMQVAAKFNPVREDGTSSPYHWTAKEIENYKRTFKEMKIEEACRKFYGTGPCRGLHFEYDSRYPNNIRWSAAHD